MTLNELANRVEAAGGADRELDAAIARSLGWTEYSKGWFVPPGLTVHHHISELPRYTASIDAALTLVNFGGEDGFCLRVLTSDDGVSHIAEVWRGDGEWASRAATPALALTAAALRARAQENEHAE